jgi:uncharacterized SAM-binding protein YcdF (DUF218 family)
MPRSMLVFQAVAPGAIPAPTDFTVGAGGFSPLSLFPSEDAAGGLAASLHEYLGIVNYYWRARLQRD